MQLGLLYAAHNLPQIVWSLSMAKIIYAQDKLAAAFYRWPYRASRRLVIVMV